MSLIKFYNLKIKRLTYSESDIINKVRANTCVDTILVSLCVLFLVCVAHTSHGLSFLMSKSFLFFIALFISFLFILRFHIWRMAVHFMLIFNSLMLYWDVFFPQTTSDLVLAQHAFISVFFSFFFVNYRFVLLYSFIALFGFSWQVLCRDAHHLPSLENSVSSFLVTVLSLCIIIFVFYRFLTTLYQLINEADQSVEHGKILTTRLQETALKAKSMAKAKNDFFSTISQGLRTPLNAIIGLTNLIIHQNKNSDRKREKLEMLLFSAESLLALMNDLIDYNQLDRGLLKLDRGPVEIVQLISKIRNGLKIKADKKGIALQFNYDTRLENLTLNVDATRLTQVIYNLTDNAIKFTSKGSVTINVNILEQDNQSVTLLFEVKDTGIGIPPDRIEAVFSPFTQATEHTTREYGGTGLGLTIVDNVLKAKGGKVQCKSEIGKGTTFMFKLNFQMVKSSSTQEHYHEDLSYLLHGIRVLIADDNKINNVVLGRVLSNWGVIFDVVYNGKDAYEAMLQQDYDLILMDINMPVMDGWESSKLIKANNPQQKIIVMTADIQYQNQVWIQEIGLEGCLIKPFKINDLQAVLLKYTRRSLRQTGTDV